jgi:hypothetical protein
MSFYHISTLGGIVLKDTKYPKQKWIKFIGKDDLEMIIYGSIALTLHGQKSFPDWK